MKMDGTTNIQIKRSTHRRLSDLGRKGDTFDDIINRLLDSYFDED